MATTLIVNPGSTSRKYALSIDGVCIVVISFEMLGDGFFMNVIRNGVKVDSCKISSTEFEHSVEKLIAYVLDTGDLETVEDITRVGIRVVCPGTYFTEHKIIDTQYINELKEKEAVAPLHIPVLLLEIQAVAQILPHATLCGISDSVFHATIPEYASTVSISKKDATKYDIKRFGYHGLSVASISKKLKKKFGSVPRRTVVCHIGGGVSITALEEGKSIATSMGYSPVSGVLMSSRGGDITAGVVAALTTLKQIQGKELYQYLYKESGFQGVAGVSDLRMVLERKASCDTDATLAIDMFVYQIQSWIARHVVQLGGIDAIVLTATASVRNPSLRKLILSNLAVLNIVLDEKKNDSLVGEEGCIHAEGSAVKIIVLKTDEMGEIEKECQKL